MKREWLLILRTMKPLVTVMTDTNNQERNGSKFLLTDEDIQIAHKQITLSDTTDILILATRMARRAGLKPVFPEQSEFSSILEFTVN